MSITFEFQKRNIRNDTISHQHSGYSLDSGEMCPVRAAAEIIMRIHSYNIPKDQVKDTPINFIQLGTTEYSPNIEYIIFVTSSI